MTIGIAAFFLLACQTPPAVEGPTNHQGNAAVTSASTWERRPCEGATEIPMSVEELLSQLKAPTREHCERHPLGKGVPALFVRTMNTIAYDESENRIPTCSWEVFRVAPDPVRHVGSLASCKFRIDGNCVVSLDEEVPRVDGCLGADGKLHP